MPTSSKSSLPHFLENWGYAKPLMDMLVRYLVKSSQSNSPRKHFYLHNIEHLFTVPYHE